ncbi:MAG: AI-2E family transporter [Kiritimatiellia bacterium]
MADKLSVRKFLENNWETVVLWTILAGLFYLLRSFFLLIFLTFLITFVTKSIVNRCVARYRINYLLATVIVFVVFVGVLAAVVSWVGPKLIMETNKVLADISGAGGKEETESTGQFADRIIKGVLGEKKAHDFIASREYAVMMESLKDEAVRAVKAVVPHVFAALLTLAGLGWKMMVALFLAVIFSFILVKDWRLIVDKISALENSRIRTLYLGAMPHLVAFAEVLGKALRAQMIIAACNTALTAAGLWLFGVPNIVLLSTIVFFCGFIPIVGTFLSSVPILLFGTQVGGLPLVLKLVALITAVHAFEAYVLNPKITGNILHIHPILVLVLLLLGERFFGVWGMVVGVPIGYYIISVLIQEDESAPPDLRRKNNPGPA